MDFMLSPKRPSADQADPPKPKKAKQIAAQKPSDQKNIKSFFSVKKASPKLAETDELSDYDRLFCPYERARTGIRYCGDALSKVSPPTVDSSIEWLKGQKLAAKTYYTCAQVRELKLCGKILDEEKLHIRYVELANSFRAPFVGTVKDVDAMLLADLAVNPAQQTLSLNYQYVSEVDYVSEPSGDEIIDEDVGNSDDQSDPDELSSFVDSDDESGLTTKFTNANTRVEINDGTQPEFWKLYETILFDGPFDASVQIKPVAPAPSRASAGMPEEPVVKQLLSKAHNQLGTRTYLTEKLFMDLKGTFPALTKKNVTAVLKEFTKSGRKDNQTVCMVNEEALKRFEIAAA